MGAGLAALVGVASESLEAHEGDHVPTRSDARGCLGCYERAIGDKEEEKAMVASCEVEYVVAQQWLSTG